MFHNGFTAVWLPVCAVHVKYLDGESPLWGLVVANH